MVTEHLGQNIDSRCLSINKILDIEENIWSPTFGLKGKIDATVQVVLRGGQNDGATLTVPLELKTGKKSKVMSHRAQTMLYTLLMTDRYGKILALFMFLSCVVTNRSHSCVLHN